MQCLLTGSFSYDVIVGMGMCYSDDIIALLKRKKNSSYD